MDPISTPTHYETLLAVIGSITEHRDLPGLFQSLYTALRRLVDFDYLGLILYNKKSDTFRLHVITATGPTPAPSDIPAAASPAGWVLEHQEPLLIPDVDSEDRWPPVIRYLRESNVKTACYLPLSTPRSRLGVIGFGKLTHHEYLPAEVEFMRNVARQLGVAVESVLYANALASERDRLQLLLEINNSLVSTLDVRQVFQRIGQALQRLIPHDYASIALLRANSRELKLIALDFPDGKGFVREQQVFPLDQALSAPALQERRPVCFGPQELARLSGPAVDIVLHQEGLRSFCAVPVIHRGDVIGTLNLGRRDGASFDEHQLNLLLEVATQVAIAVANARSYREIERLSSKLAQEKLYLEDEIRAQHDFTEMVGRSPAFQRALQQVETVAATDANVLILGETGTGKELVARAIHSRSARRQRPLIKLNCAAIPTGLLESELFGHEKGAFTGAIAQRIGRLELAHRGTLFLDEVGDIPLELQPKLLRALQEQEFERLGSSRTQKVDVRLISATNRDLGAMVEAREFRSDLYYRLNVFPIHLPALRERREDIPLLVRYFAQKFAQQFGKPIERIPQPAMDALERYDWPGNIRELENLIERAVIISRGDTLQVPLPEAVSSARQLPAPTTTATPTLEETERAHILRVLDETNWKIAGREGAAERLGLKRTTLLSRMDKLGIERPR